MLDPIPSHSVQELHAMHSLYMQRLGLDENQDGETVATLLEDMVTENSANWQERATGLLEETLKILREKSLKEAMFFLGDRINIRDVDHRRTACKDPVLLDRQLGFKQALQNVSRSAWKPETRAIAGSFGLAPVPTWYESKFLAKKLA